MQRNKMLTCAVALVALVVCWQAGEAGEKKKLRKAEQPPSAPPANAAKYPMLFDNISPPAGAAAPKDEAQVQELITILNETKSASTLVATAIALLPLGDKAKPAVPAILRNAERLKVLEDIGKPATKKGEVAAMLMEIVFAIQSGWTPDDDRPSALNQRWGFQQRYQAAPPQVMPSP